MHLVERGQVDVVDVGHCTLAVCERLRAEGLAYGGRNFRVEPGSVADQWLNLEHLASAARHDAHARVLVKAVGYLDLAAAQIDIRHAVNARRLKRHRAVAWLEADGAIGCHLAHIGVAGGV